jgi:RNA polymerase sigma-70 factor (ECF subfamily)
VQLPALSGKGSRFETDLLMLLPNLRAFSLRLTHRNDAEDLVQDTLAKAWTARATFQAGTNLKAWLFTIMRNVCVSGRRRAWRSVPLDPQDAENALVAHDDASASDDLSELSDAMQRLPEMQRRLLLLAGPAGLSYAEMAKIMGCAIGTVKSRVSRARTAAMLSIAQGSRRADRRGTPPSAVFNSMMMEAAHLSRSGALSMGGSP